MELLTADQAAALLDAVCNALDLAEEGEVHAGLQVLREGLLQARQAADGSPAAAVLVQEFEEAAGHYQLRYGLCGRSGV